MDSISYSLQGISLRDSHAVPDDWKRGFESFFSRSVELVGECPPTEGCPKEIQNRFFLSGSASCPMDARCLSLIRMIRKIEKTQRLEQGGGFLFRSFVIEVVGLIEIRIEKTEADSSFVPNSDGKLAFSHFLAAIVLLYGLISGVINDRNSYEHHRNEARKHNGSCTRILSLPNVSSSFGHVSSAITRQWTSTEKKI